MIYLQASASCQDTLVVYSERQTFWVSSSGLVCEKDVRVLHADIQNPLGKRNEDIVTNIATALMEGHHHLK